jgi:hypothetical protein
MQAGGLTPPPLAAKAGTMNRATLALTAAAAALLAGCNQEDHTIVAGGPVDEPAAEAPEANGPVVLPPSISASKTYRCGSSTIVHVNWMSDGKSATIRGEQGGSPVLVTAPEPGQALTSAGGHSLTGTAEASSVSITLPGGSAQTCKA